MSELEVVPSDKQVREYPRREGAHRQLTLPNLFDVFLRLKSGMSKSHLNHFLSIKTKFCDFVGDKELTPMLLEEWTQMIRSTPKAGGRLVTGAYVNEVNSKVRAFLKWLSAMGHIPHDISSTVRRVPQSGPKESLIWTEQDYETMKKFLAAKPTFQTHLWLIILAYRTGMSSIDCAHLRWCHVHMRDDGPSYIKIPRMKNARHGESAICYIPLIPGTDVWQWLIMLKNAERYNFHNGINDYVHQEAPGLHACAFHSFTQDIRSLVRRAGINPELRFRHLRNSFCSNLVNSEVQIALICKMTGHQNIKTLLRYVQPDTKALQDGLARAFQDAAARQGTINTNLGVAKL